MAMSSLPAMFFEEPNPMNQQHSPVLSSSMATPSAPPKRKRNPPGTPNPDAEVVALSPEAIMTTHRFVCEVCNHGFYREQNLQLHRRGHNLPWKLKQRTTRELRKKVYVCPESTCVHHDPSRALGDLTGIKKHFFRKHCEKKWSCVKCRKNYAVESDWKAHSKICGAKEYKCDCGILFPRKESFISHRAFCEALSQEGLNHLNGNGNNTPDGLDITQEDALISPTQEQNNQFGHGDILHLGPTQPEEPDHLHLPSINSTLFPPPNTPSFGSFYTPEFIQPIQDYHVHDQNKTFHGLMEFPDQVNIMDNQLSPIPVRALSPPIYGTSFQNNYNAFPNMSATAILQNATHVGSTSSSNTFHDLLFGENESYFNDLIFGTESGPAAPAVGGVNNMFTMNQDMRTGFGNMEGPRMNPSSMISSYEDPDRFTRDFLGVGHIVRSMTIEVEIVHHQQHLQLLGMDSQTNFMPASQSFGGGSDGRARN